MKPVLWLGLALACGGALAVSWLPDDEPAEALVRMPAAGAAPARDVRVQAAAPTATGVVVETAVDPSADAANPRQAWPALAAGARAAWSPPTRVAPAVSPPPPPAPPPVFPYQWLGQMQDSTQTRWFVASPQQTLALATGDTVDQKWRVEGIEGGRLRLTWLATGASVHITPR